MCGIAGEASFGRGPVVAEHTRAMCSRLVHRGPDEAGLHASPEVALGIRRLRIIGLQNGSQPVYGATQATRCVFNGEIYNHRQLRAELALSGCVFRTESDAEVITFAYEQFGLGFVQRLEGMFAFALYDATARLLILARDRAGKKPLFYQRTAAGTVVFASELGALMAHPDVGGAVSADAIDMFLSFRVVPAPHTIYRDVFKVEPGTFIVLSAEQAVAHRYFAFDLAHQVEGRDDLDVAADLTRRLEAAVETRLQSEVPLGAFASGGLDSSLIVALTAPRVPDRLHTFAVGFDDPAFDELRFARTVAAHCNTQHHEYRITADAALAALDEMLGHLGEPFAFPSIIACYFMSQLAKRHVTVVLSGDGADELFAGYNRYKTFAALPQLPVEPHRRRRIDLDVLAAADGDIAAEYGAILTDGLRDGLKARLYSPAFRKSLGAEFPVNHLTQRFASNAGLPTRLDRVLDVDLKFWLRDAQLVKIDIASMAHAVEVRAPMLDRHVVELACSLPMRHKLRGAEEKHILKRVAERFLPRMIVERPKQELAVPLEHWVATRLRGELRRTVLSERALARGYFDPGALGTFVDQATSEDTYALYTLYVLERWHQIAEGAVPVHAGASFSAARARRDAPRQERPS